MRGGVFVNLNSEETMDFLSEIPLAYKAAKKWVDPPNYNDNVGKFIDEYTKWDDWRNETLNIDPITLDEFNDLNKKITWIETRNDNHVVKNFDKASLRGLMRHMVDPRLIPQIEDPTTRTQIPREVIMKLREPEIASTLSPFDNAIIEMTANTNLVRQIKDWDWKLEWVDPEYKRDFERLINTMNKASKKDMLDLALIYNATNVVNVLINEPYNIKPSIPEIGQVMKRGYLPMVKLLVRKGYVGDLSDWNSTAYENNFSTIKAIYNAPSARQTSRLPRHWSVLNAVIEHNNLPFLKWYAQREPKIINTVLKAGEDIEYYDFYKLVKKDRVEILNYVVDYMIANDISITKLKPFLYILSTKDSMLPILKKIHRQNRKLIPTMTPTMREQAPEVWTWLNQLN